MYYKNVINNHNNSSKALWKTFGKILNNKQIKHAKIGSLSVDGKTQTDPKTIATTFNDFFSEIGEKLASKFSNQNSSEFKKYLGSPIPHSMFLYSITEAEIINVISKLKTSNSTGHDGYNTKFIKLSISVLAPALVKNLTCQLTQGYTPTVLKLLK